MPRPLRIQYAGARYHIMSRSDGPEAIFHYQAACSLRSATKKRAVDQSARLVVRSASLSDARGLSDDHHLAVIAPVTCAGRADHVDFHVVELTRR